MISPPDSISFIYVFSRIANESRGNRCFSLLASWSRVRIARYGTDIVLYMTALSQWRIHPSSFISSILLMYSDLPKHLHNIEKAN